MSDRDLEEVIDVWNRKPRLCRYIIALKMFHQVRRSQEGGGGGEGEKINNGWLFYNSVKKRFFQAFTTVSGSSSAEGGWTDINANWK